MDSTDLSSQEKQRKFHELQIPLLRDTSIEALLWICPLVALWVSNHVVEMPFSSEQTKSVPNFSIWASKKFHCQRTRYKQGSLDNALSSRVTVHSLRTVIRVNLLKTNATGSSYRAIGELEHQLITWDPGASNGERGLGYGSWIRVTTK